ncbi:ABC transporter ATP-binding protein [Nocardia tengchongensis]|uniref:ABC transporter ATP-binding protein n=1 Tax=Nocardia tengchongensis TaxID=2055889 RepID=UPI0036A89BE0
MTHAVEVSDFAVESASGTRLLAPISLRVSAGTVAALTGPSGAGKTTLMRAILGHLPVGAAPVSGSIRVAGQDVFALDALALRSWRRRHIAFVSQDPGAALNPMMRISGLLREAGPRSTDLEQVGVLERVGLPARYLRRRPGELSGGEQRRIALAVALIRQVEVLVVDEPLAGLHGQLSNDIAGLLRSLATEAGVGVVVSGHNTRVLHQLADDVVSVGAAPAAPERLPVRMLDSGEPGPISLRARGIAATAGRKTLLGSVDLEIAAGEAVAVVGPSGAGKTTLSRVLAGIHTAASGSLEVDGRALAVGRGRRSRRDRRRIQLIPQNPLSTLNPRHTVLQALSRPLRLNGISSRTEIATRAASLLADVDLPADMLGRLPDELSGGQRQRVAIARALAGEPDVLICDEITSALHAATAESVMDLVERTQITRGIGVLVVSHDMAVVARYCRRIVVLADGVVVEHGDTATVLAEPIAPQTKVLVV